MTDAADSLDEALTSPKTVKSDGTEVTQHSIRELIEADRHQANKTAAQSRTLPVRFFHTKPPGTV